MQTEPQQVPPKHGDVPPPDSQMPHTGFSDLVAPKQEQAKEEHMDLTPSNIYRDFKTVQEVVEYAQRLEGQLLSRPQNQEGRALEPQPKVEPPKEGVSPGDILWEDPNRAFDMAVKKAVSESVRVINADLQKDKNKQNFWGDFYSRNPDLKGFEDDVNMTLSKFGGELGPMEPNNGMKVLADRTRAKLRQVVDKLSKGTQLPSGGGVTVPTSGPSAPQREPEPQVVGFVDQINNLRRKKSTSGS